MTADVTVEADIEAVIDRTEDEIGPIDLFASNAGILGFGGIEAPTRPGTLAWTVNVLAHLYAARAVVPRMIERGGGYLLSTASAAGLLTQPGDAPYSVTKHAAVALAEWLAITYGDQGIKVSCLCPMAVDTAMLGGARDDGGTRPERRRGRRGAGRAGAGQVAEAVVEGLREERSSSSPTPRWPPSSSAGPSDRDRWLAGMRRLNTTLAGGAPPAAGPADMPSTRRTATPTRRAAGLRPGRRRPVRWRDRPGALARGAGLEPRAGRQRRRCGTSAGASRALAPRAPRGGARGPGAAATGSPSPTGAARTEQLGRCGPCAERTARPARS